MKKIIGVLCVLTLVLVSAAALAADVGDYITFGVYEQDNDLANGKEPIEWLVLDKNSSGLLVVSRYVLDNQPYHVLAEDVTWETCYLRMWLNGHFMNEAFTADERDQILTTTVRAEANTDAYFWTYAGNSTKDQVFLLSYSQANRYFPGEGDSNCEPTAYAEAQGAIVPAHNRVFSRYSKNVTSTIWWLRTVGSKQDNACHVLASGGPDMGGNAVENTAGVRPAMWINLAP